MTQLYCSLAMCSKGWNAVPQILAQPRSLLPRSQKRGERNNPDILQLMDAEQKWVQHTTEYSSPGKKMKLWDFCNTQLKSHFLLPVVPETLSPDTNACVSWAWTFQPALMSFFSALNPHLPLSVITAMSPWTMAADAHGSFCWWNIELRSRTCPSLSPLHRGMCPTGI